MTDEPTRTEVLRLREQLADSEAEVEQLNRRVQEEIWVFNQLVSISAELNSTQNMPQLLRQILNSTKELFGAEACSIILVDERTNELVFEVAVGEKSEEVSKLRIPAGRGIAGRVVQTGESMIVDSVKDSQYFYDGVDHAVGFETRNMLAVPLKAQKGVIGVVEIVNAQGLGASEQRDLALATALASQAAVAIDNARLHEQLKGELAALEHLLKVSTLLSSTLNSKELLRTIIGVARELLNAQTASVMLLDETTKELVFETAVGEKSDDVLQQRIPPGRGIAGRVVETGEPMIVDSVKNSPYFYRQVDQSVGFDTQNMLALPLSVKGKLIGVMEIINKQDGFAQGDLKLATALASQAAVAIDNALLYQKLADALVTTRMSYRL